MHPSGGVLDTEEHIDPFQEHGIDVQKVDSENAVSLGGEELPPARSGPSRCGWQTGLKQDGAHGTGGEAVAEAEEFSGDALVTPVRIFAGQL